MRPATCCKCSTIPIDRVIVPGRRSGDACGTSEQEAVGMVAGVCSGAHVDARTRRQSGSQSVVALRHSSCTSTLHGDSTDRCCVCGAVLQLKLQLRAPGVLQQSAPPRQSSFQPSLGDENGRGARTGTSLKNPSTRCHAPSRQLHGQGGGRTGLGSMRAGSVPRRHVTLLETRPWVWFLVA